MDTANGKRVCKKATKKFAHATTTKENKPFLGIFCKNVDFVTSESVEIYKFFLKTPLVKLSSVSVWQ